MSIGETVDFDSLGTDIQELIEDGVKAREFAYVPYSNFKVGAALRCEDGTIKTGCNVENAAFSSTCCAERTAIFKAVSEGQRKFKSLAVVAQLENTFVSPCGVCRQVTAEFGDIPIYLAKPSLGKVFVTSLKDLLPLAFGLNASNEKMSFE